MLKVLKKTALLALMLAISQIVQAKIFSEVVDYQIEGQNFQGYISYDDEISGKRPGVLVVHEWWGHNQYARTRAEMLAKLGYVAFAIDMYGQGKLAKHPDDALKFMQAVLAKASISENRFKQAKKLLKNHPKVDQNQIAAIGYCFGGSTVLNMAKTNDDLLAVVSFHGALASVSGIEENQIKAKVLVLNGAADPFISVEQVFAFKQQMDNAKVAYDFVNYPDVQHSFTNPEADSYGKRFNMPLVYNQAADKDSWLRMQQLFKAIFSPQ